MLSPSSVNKSQILTLRVESLYEINQIYVILTANLKTINDESNRTKLVNMYKSLFSDAANVKDYENLISNVDTMRDKFKKITCSTPIFNKNLTKVYKEIDVFLTDIRKSMGTIKTFIEYEHKKLVELNKLIDDISKKPTYSGGGGSVRKIKQYTQSTRKTKLKTTQIGGGKDGNDGKDIHILKTKDYLEKLITDIEKIQANILRYTQLLEKKK